ncbi:MAG: hypothetical protein IKP65_06030 [Alphaproteobacteria bacterium]|nr:hypothetical protein [Alphaproteobacteria bacterium]
MFGKDYLRIDAVNDRINNDIAKEVRSNRHKEYNQMLREQHPEDQVNHFRRQEKILIDSIDNAKTDAERYIAVKRLSFCRQNLSKWLKIADNQR